MACDSSRFDAIIEKRIPLVLSVGALDMVNFGSKDTVPSSFHGRNIYEHNKQVVLLCDSILLICSLTIFLIDFRIIVSQINCLSHYYSISEVN